MAEEKGIVNKNSEAILNIKLIDGTGIDCLLDTGFNGNLILPASFIENHSSTIMIRVTVELAEGKTAELGMTTVKIKWLGEEIPINILISETDECLIGTELLTDTILEINYRTSTVTITK